MNNYMSIRFKSVSENEALARASIAAFVSSMNPSVEDLADIKTSVSEAVTNCIVHGYDGGVGMVEMSAYTEGGKLTVKITDRGKGIHNIEQAREPLYTTKADAERSGMGFTIMESFMDSIRVISHVGKGTTVIMSKVLSREMECDDAG